VFSERVKLQLDGNKLFHHLDSVENWLKGEEIFPLYIAFSPSSLCNHSCSFCVYHYKTFEPIYFPLERYRELVDEWSRLGVKSVFFAGDGDPLLNRNCAEMARYTHERGISIAMNTNGRALNPEKSRVLARSLEWIRFSVNAGTPESYSRIHGTHARDFGIVLENIAGLVEARRESGSEITIGTQCVLLEDNLADIPKLAETMKAIGVDYLAVKPFLKHPLISQAETPKNIDAALRSLRKVQSMTDERFKFVLRENLFREGQARSYHQCLAGPFMIEIDARGDVYSCGPYIGNADHRYGNVMSTSFEEMWRSELKKKIMNRIENQVDVKACMPFCRPDSVNRLLWELKNPPEHVNYI
jgi:radical SAM protein with 4Fe4S-binding SPASM domain